ncbi:hypothetical protein CPB86DRAFT_821014 [Serendipita vermifera]|nr:hypothetical protein CPB86DRAFT_821014 [Serendipita vermifera]
MPESPSFVPLSLKAHQMPASELYLKSLGLVGGHYHRLLASPILSIALEQSVKSEGFSICSLLRGMVDFRWFCEEFSRANGLDWLPLIALNTLPTQGRAPRDGTLTEILVDQILSSTANRDIQATLSSSYHYLQSIGHRRKPQHHDRLVNLRTALL